jgi:hypothetical protein
VEGDKWACAVVGSANLTRDGLYRNVELATLIHLDLSSIIDVEIYQHYDAFLSELLNPRNPNVQPLNEATLKWLAEMVIVEDEARVPEPQTVTRSRRATAKLKGLAHAERFQLGYRRPTDLPDVLLDEAETSLRASFTSSSARRIAKTPWQMPETG